jgi:hypothetical protein
VHLLQCVRKGKKGRISSDLPLSGNVADISLSVCLASSMRDDGRSVVDEKGGRIRWGDDYQILRSEDWKYAVFVEETKSESVVAVCQKPHMFETDKERDFFFFVGLQRKKGVVVSSSFYIYAMYTRIV